MSYYGRSLMLNEYDQKRKLRSAKREEGRIRTSDFRILSVSFNGALEWLQYSHKKVILIYIL